MPLNIYIPTEMHKRTNQQTPNLDIFLTTERKTCHIAMHAPYVSGARRRPKKDSVAEVDMVEYIQRRTGRNRYQLAWSLPARHGYFRACKPTIAKN